MSKGGDNYYDLLDVERGDDSAAIKKAFKKAALVHHPDKGGTDVMFQKINQAWTILGDATKRATYDRELKNKGSKDGTGGKGAGATRQQSSDKAGAQRQQTNNQSAPQKAQGPVEIPKDLTGLSVKELKAILVGLGLKTDDCYEKADLIGRIQEFKDNKKSKGKSKPPKASGNAAEQKEKPQFTDMNFDSGSYTYMPPQDGVIFKITSVGNAEVGKSCLIKRYCEGRFVKRYIQTIGVDYGVKKVTIDDHSVSINFFDLSGNKDYKVIRTEFYTDTTGILMVYDVDNKDSFASLIHWEDEMKRYGVDMARVKVVVAGNKCDLKGREVQPKDAQAWCRQRNYTWFETSANVGTNVSESLEHLFKQCLDQHLEDKKRFGIK